MVVVPPGNEHAVTTDAEAVELVYGVAVVGRPSGAAEDTNTGRRDTVVRETMMRVSFGPAIKRFRAPILHPEILREVGDHRAVVILFFQSRYTNDDVLLGSSTLEAEPAGDFETDGVFGRIDSGNDISGGPVGNVC